VRPEEWREEITGERDSAKPEYFNSEKAGIQRMERK